MPKSKTRSSAKKRYRMTAKGHLKCKKSLARHILTKKTTKRKRKMRRTAIVNASYEKRLHTMLIA